MNETLTGEQIRASYVRPTGDIELAVLRCVERHGPCTTGKIAHTVEGLRAGALSKILAGLVDSGKVIAVRQPTTPRGGRPGVIYSVA